MPSSVSRDNRSPPVCFHGVLLFSGISPATSQPTGSVACETLKRRRQFCRHRTRRLNTSSHICSVACWIKNENILRSYTRPVFLRPAVIRALRDRCLERLIFPRLFYFRLRTSVTILPYSCFYVQNVFFPTQYNAYRRYTQFDRFNTLNRVIVIINKVRINTVRVHSFKSTGLL